VLALSALALGFWLRASSRAQADSVDPLLPKRVVAGAPHGAAPAERVDGRRTGRATSRLPFPPTEVWQRRVSGGLDVSPIVDAQGSIVAALTSPHVAKLAQDGRELWRTHVGAPALAPPAILSDGTIVVITTAGQAAGLAPDGGVKFTSSLGLKGKDTDVAPLATTEGGLVVAAGRSIVAIDADGIVRARAALEERASAALVAGPEGTLVTTESGTVYLFRPPGAPRRVGAFGGALRRGAVLADARTLLGVVEGKNLVALDLPTGTAHVRSGAVSGSGYFDGPPAVAFSGRAVTGTYGGLLLEVDSSGAERALATLEKQLITGSPDAGAVAGGALLAVDLRQSPPVVVDPDGRVAFARVAGRVGVVAPDGAVAIVNERLCGTPLAVQPAGERRMLVACRDGTLWMIGEAQK